MGSTANTTAETHQNMAAKHVNSISQWNVAYSSRMSVLKYKVVHWNIDYLAQGVSSPRAGTWGRAAALFSSLLSTSCHTFPLSLVCCQTRRSLCEEALLKIRGVISFTFQMAVKRCVVRIRSDLKAEVSACLHTVRKPAKSGTLLLCSDRGLMLFENAFTQWML